MRLDRINGESMECEIKNELKCKNCGSCFDIITHPGERLYDEYDITYIRKMNTSLKEIIKGYLTVLFDVFLPGDWCLYKKVVCPFCGDHRSWCMRSQIKKK